MDVLVLYFHRSDTMLMLDVESHSSKRLWVVVTSLVLSKYL